jgi:hypothetical protein
MLIYVCLQVASDGQFILCQCRGVINVINYSTGIVARSLQHVSMVVELPGCFLFYLLVTCTAVLSDVCIVFTV